MQHTESLTQTLSSSATDNKHLQEKLFKFQSQFDLLNSDKKETIFQIQHLDLEILNINKTCVEIQNKKEEEM